MQGTFQIKMAKSNYRLLCYTFFYMTFVILGAAIFSAIEAPDEMDRIRELRKKRQQFLRDNECVSGKYTTTSTHIVMT